MDFQNGNQQGFDPGRYQPPKKPVNVSFNGKKIKRIVMAVIAAIFLISAAGTCFYTVDEKESAVVTTFGRVTDVTGAGMHFMLPFGIQQVYLVEENVYQKIELGYRSEGDGNEFEIYEDESKMITGDYNIVNVDFFIEYKVSDPVKYLYSSSEPVMVLKNLAQSQIRNVIGSAVVDSIPTDGKSEIQMQVQELIAEGLAEYDIGLALTDVKIQDAEPPTEDVVEAFRNVETAKQGAETAVNEALAYQNAQLPLAQAQADKLLQNAEYVRQNRVNEARQQVAMFEAMYSEYVLNPQITRVRMYYEAIREAFPNARIYIDATDGSVQKLLPLETIVGQ